jgi:hypothetical protein
MHLLALTILGILVTLTPARAADRFSIVLSPQIRYQDPDLSCATDGTMAAILFSGMIDGARVFHASLKEMTKELIAAKLSLLPEETAEMVLLKGPGRNFRLKEFPIGPRILEWLIYNAGGRVMPPCRPSTTLRTLSPSSFPFHFERLSEPTAWASFQGTLHDGRRYRAELRLEQGSTRP